MALRPDLKKIEKSYSEVVRNWEKIDNTLDELGIGRKDTPFDDTVMQNMLLAWEYIDHFIRKKGYRLISRRGYSDMLEINNLVHYGVDQAMRKEYKKAIAANAEKFSMQVPPIRKYYENKMEKGCDVDKVAAEIFISILGMPQLFIEGNHRSGSIIASWINLANNKPPYVLTVSNAVAYFVPAQEIKKFDQRSVWRSVTKLPKYKKAFKKFWKNYCDMQFAQKA